MQQLRDSEIEQWVIRELNLAADIRSKEVCAFCLDGTVTLRGTVHRDTSARAAEAAAWRAPAVSNVINKICVTDIQHRAVPLAAMKVQESLSRTAQATVSAAAI